MTPAAQPQILTVAQVASEWGFHPMTVYRWAREKSIPAQRAGRCWRFRRDELERHFKAQARGIA